MFCISIVLTKHSQRSSTRCEVGRENKKVLSHPLLFEDTEPETNRDGLFEVAKREAL